MAGLLPENAGLSMGMSRDFEVAIEEGATVLRIGSGLFEGLPTQRKQSTDAEGGEMKTGASVGESEHDEMPARDHSSDDGVLEFDDGFADDSD